MSRWIKGGLSLLLIGSSLLGTGNLSIWAQGRAGVSSIFSMGAGARELGMGGASVASPITSSTIFWNPAGMESLPRKTLTVFYASLPLGTSYNFLGYVHPTLNIGTFGLGVLHISTGGIVERSEHFEELGEFGYNQTEILFSYAKKFLDILSLGINFKLERQVIGNYSDTGFGVDVGLLYPLPFSEGILSNITFGLNIQNAYSPRIKPGETTDYIPHNIKFGLAKAFYFEEAGIPLRLALDFDQGDLAGFSVRFGTEYIYKQVAAFRVGVNAGGICFGAGLSLQGKYQLDYAYAQMADGVFPPSHRLSLTFAFGKTRREMLELAERRQREAIQAEIEREQARLRQAAIERYMSEGKQAFEMGDYFEALIKFSQALELDSENPEAKRLREETRRKIDEIEARKRAEQLAKIQAERERREIEAFVKEHMERGRQLLEQGKYSDAMGEFSLALERQPENSFIKEAIQKAREALVNKVNGLVTKADRLARRGSYNEAIRLLGEAQLLIAEVDEETRKKIERKIAGLERRIQMLDYYQEGLREYRAENWMAAMQAFEKALKLDPRNEKVAYYYREAERRALAREEEMTPEMEKKFYRAVQLYLNDKFEEAIKIFEELLEEQPYNKRIIDNLDNARKQLEKRRKARKK